VTKRVKEVMATEVMVKEVRATGATATLMGDSEKRVEHLEGVEQEMEEKVVVTKEMVAVWGALKAALAAREVTMARVMMVQNEAVVDMVRVALEEVVMARV